MQDVHVAAECYGHPTAELTARVLYFDRAARWRRALGIGGALTLGALVSLVIPVWHFIGVPGCLIGAFVLGRSRLHEEQRLVSVAGPCPACGAALELTPTKGQPLPAVLRCPECGEFLKVSELR